MRIIRASDVGTFQFCERAWWYRQQGYNPENQTELDQGTVVHENHGRLVKTSFYLRILAFGLILLGLITAITWFFQRVI